MATDLFSSMTIGGQELKNRMVMAPLTRGRCDEGSVQPNEVMKEYYTQRASAGLIITEATAISEEAYGWRNAPMISTEENAVNWKKITDSVHAKGSKIYLQLWHMGRQSHSSFHPSTGDIVSASAIPVGSGTARDAKGESVEWETPRALTVEQIKATIQDFVKAARLSKQAGFDGVEVHSANGYLLDQFLQLHTNQRTDQYGGSMENRARFLLEVIEAIIADGAVPAHRIGVRLSPNGVFGDMGSEDNDVMFPWVAEKLSKYGLAYLHVMDGLGFGFHGKTKVVTAMDMKIAFKGPIMVNVGLTKESADECCAVVLLICAALAGYSFPILIFPNDSKMDGH